MFKKVKNQNLNIMKDKRYGNFEIFIVNNLFFFVETRHISNSNFLAEKFELPHLA